jgi:hypothetical protein
MIRSRLAPVSARRLHESWLYEYRRKQFLAAHPYCQVWLAEHGVEEADAIHNGGRVEVNGTLLTVPLSTEIHHKNKRRGFDLLDPSEWLAVSADAHRRIESEKDWARARGYLRDF